MLGNDRGVCTALRVCGVEPSNCALSRASYGREACGPRCGVSRTGCRGEASADGMVASSSGPGVSQPDQHRCRRARRPHARHRRYAPDRDQRPPRSDADSAASSWTVRSIARMPVIVQAYALPSEPVGFGDDAHRLWQLLQGVVGWSCVNVAAPVGPALAEVIEGDVGPSLCFVSRMCIWSSTSRRRARATQQCGG